MTGKDDLELSYDLAGTLCGEVCDLNESGQISTTRRLVEPFQ